MRACLKQGAKQVLGFRPHSNVLKLYYVITLVANGLVPVLNKKNTTPMRNLLGRCYSPADTHGTPQAISSRGLFFLGVPFAAEFFLASWGFLVLPPQRINQRPEMGAWCPLMSWIPAPRMGNLMLCGPFSWAKLNSFDLIRGVLLLICTEVKGTQREISPCGSLW